MSFDVEVRTSCPHCGTRRTHWEWSGMTYNLSPMFSKAGIYDLIKAVGLAHGKASVLITPIEFAVEQMRTKPAEYESLNPGNGWGSYEIALKFLDQLLSACRENPDAEVDWSG